MKPALKLLIGDNEYRAIGHLAAQWALLENQFDFVISVLSEQPKMKSQKSKASLSFSRRMEELRGMANQVLKHHPQSLSEIPNISNEASSLRRFRDDIIHGQWKRVAQNGESVPGIRLSSIIRNTKIKETPFSFEKTEAVASKISYVSYNLIMWIQRNIPCE